VRVKIAQVPPVPAVAFRPGKHGRGHCPAELHGPGHYGGVSFGVGEMTLEGGFQRIDSGLVLPGSLPVNAFEQGGLSGVERQEPVVLSARLGYRQAG
jgi:hypothetical protein